MNRPVVWAALAFAGGIGLVDIAPLPPLFIAGAVLCLLGLYTAPHTLPYRDGFLVALVFLLAGSVWTTIRADERRGDSLSNLARDHPDRVYELEGTIIDAPVMSAETDYMALGLRVDRVTAGDKSLPQRGHVILRWSMPNRAVYPGERIRVRSPLSPILGEVNMDMSGIEDYYRGHGYHSVARARSGTLEHLAAPTLHLRYWAARLRQWEADLFARCAPVAAQPLLRAVWLGDRSALSNEDRAPYLKTGTAHILAVSGVHIGILYLTMQLVLRGLIQNRKRRAALILLFIMIFALVTGARTPILRATTMLALYLWAEFLDRDPDAPTALGLAALLFLGYNPALLCDAGFALSFTSLASLLLFSQPLAERFTALPAAIQQNAAATLGVSILPLPLIAHTFHVLSVVGPLCNLLVIPLLGALLWLALLTVATGIVSTEVASLFGHATYPIIWAIRTISEWGAALPSGHRVVTSPTGLACLAYGLLTLGLYGWAIGHHRPRRCLALAGSAALATWLLWQPLYRPPTLDALDVGHGDATFIRTPGGTTLLIDGGDKSRFVDQGARTVTPWLLNQGVDYLDYVVATHPDRDHIGGLLTVLEQIEVGEVVLWPEVSTDPDAQALVALCDKREIPLRRVKRGDTLPTEDATVTVLHPQGDHLLSGPNNQSLVLRVQWPGMDALLTGDIEAEAEQELLSHLAPLSLLKVPHHGSFTSSTAAFLDVTAPRIALISNRNAVPDVVEQRYVERGIRVYRTAYHGGIRLRARNGKLHVQTARGQRGYSLAPSSN